MKMTHRPLVLIAFAFSCLLGAGACSSGSDPANAEGALQTEVVRHTEEELSNLKPGESLRLDLTLGNQIHAITYTHPSILERIVVVSRDGEQSLIDWAGDAISSDGEGQKQLVLEGDRASDFGRTESNVQSGDCAEQVGEAQEGLSLRIRACKCPCCMEVSGHLVCCG